MIHISALKKVVKRFLPALFVVLVISGGVAVSTIATDNSREGLLRQYSLDILKQCSGSEYRPSCYDTEIPKLMDSGVSMEDAYYVTRYIQKEDTEYFYCHVLGHNLSAKETAKDPSKWKDVVARAPSGMCSNGGIHGAFQERFRAESLPDANLSELRSILSGVCDKREGWNPTSLEQATCTHALGHLAMYITDAHVENSVDLCREVAIRYGGNDFTQICFDGVFMQIFQPLEPEDFGLIEDIAPKTKEDALVFCSQFEGKVYESCHSESWPLSLKEIKTPEGLVGFCGLMTNEGRNRCFNALFYVVTTQFRFNEERMTHFCSEIPETQKGQCFANTASRMIETDWSMIDASVRICKTAEEFAVGDICYNELLLYSTYNFHKDSKEFVSLCRALPGEWEKRCFNGQ
ncbi:MAG: hypothetical protein WD509_00905 [Candidatus Paceibacterota bacterium]